MQRIRLILAAMIVTIALTAPLAAFDNVDARTTWTMVKKGEASLVDTRTLEEAMWVGSPADADGKAIATLIPWVAVSIAADGSSAGEPNARFDELFTRTFPDKDQAVVLMCRSGHRSKAAAEHLETLGYSKLYNLDSPTATTEEGLGVGGFQGGSNMSGHTGYRGFPGRVGGTESVSWLDSGLPITSKLDPALIPK